MANIKVDAYSTYFGGKSGAGTYQVLINHIPPHDTFISLFLGNCGITRHIKPAAQSILNDLDERVIASWKTAIGDHKDYTLLNVDAIAFLRSSIAEKFDTAGVFIYLDPPYLFSTRKGQIPVYRHELTEDQHRIILELIKKFKYAHVMISHYPNDMYNQALKDWNQYDYYSTIRGGIALERIYYNYDLTDELHDYSFIGKNFREREKFNRIKNNYLKKLKRLDPKLRNSILADLAPQDNAMVSVDVADLAIFCEDTR